MLKQISIFTENKKGAMQKITGILKDSNINIWGSMNSDSPEYGIVRMVVSDPEKALEILEKANYQVKLTNVMGVELDDKVGALNNLLATISECNVFINYIYLSFSRDSAKPVMVLAVDDLLELEECLSAKGFPVL